MSEESELLRRRAREALAECLGPTTDLDSSDSLFELGASSLDILRIAHALTSVAGKPIRPKFIFQNPSVHALELAVVRARRSADDEVNDA